MICEDFIRLTGLEIYAHHGVLQEEKDKGQPFYVNALLYYDMRCAGESDDLENALNYAEVSHFITKIFKEKSYDLIEAACENLCRQLLLRYKILKQVTIELQKPQAPIGLPFSNVSVNMTRRWHEVYLAIGSNMGNKQEFIEQGILELKQSKDIRNVAVSDLIETKPYGPVEQESFLNGCIRLETLLLPEELLLFLHEIEAHANRKREIVWGPRTLDLDIVFYDKEVYESRNLIIPHVDMHNRLFVLEPLKELCPNYRHPILGLTVQQMYERLCSLGEKV